MYNKYILEGGGEIFEDNPKGLAARSAQGELAQDKGA